MRGLCAVALLLGVASPRVARAQEKRPVSPECLSGRTLVLTQRNCSIDAPGDDWVWEQSPTDAGGNETYYCRRGRTMYVLQVNPRARVEVNAEFMNGVRKAIEKPLEAQGGRLDAFDWKESSLPIAGRSARYEMTSHQSGVELHWFVYLTAAPFTYQLMSVTAEAEEREEFRQFVGSFRLLKEPDLRSPAEKAGEAVGKLVGTGIGITLMGAIVYYMVAGQKKPVRPRPPRRRRKPRVEDEDEDDDEEG